jgi:hypothetical protein
MNIIYIVNATASYLDMIGTQVVEEQKCSSIATADLFSIKQSLGHFLRRDIDIDSEQFTNLLLPITIHVGHVYIML